MNKSEKMYNLLLDATFLDSISCEMVFTRNKKYTIASRMENG